MEEDEKEDATLKRALKARRREMGNKLLGEEDDDEEESDEKGDTKTSNSNAGSKWSKEEDSSLLAAVTRYGERWDKIIPLFKGRTLSAIRSKYWQMKQQDEGLKTSVDVAPTFEDFDDLSDEDRDEDTTDDDAKRAPSARPRDRERPVKTKAAAVVSALLQGKKRRGRPPKQAVADSAERQQLKKPRPSSTGGEDDDRSLHEKNAKKSKSGHPRDDPSSKKSNAQIDASLSSDSSRNKSSSSSSSTSASASYASSARPSLPQPPAQFKRSRQEVMASLEEHNAELALVGQVVDASYYESMFERLDDPTAKWSGYQETLIRAAMRTDELSKEAVMRLYQSF
jgi:hypothetical protein